MRRNPAVSFTILGLLAAPLLASPAWAQSSTPRDTSNSGSSSVGKGTSSSPAVTPPRSGSTPRDNSNTGSSQVGPGRAQSPAVTPPSPVRRPGTSRAAAPLPVAGPVQARRVKPLRDPEGGV